MMTLGFDLVTEIHDLRSLIRAASDISSVANKTAEPSVMHDSVTRILEEASRKADELSTRVLEQELRAIVERKSVDS